MKDVKLGGGNAPRVSYDHLVGPMRLVPIFSGWGLAPDVSGSAWRIELMRTGKHAELFYRRVAALAEADEERIRDEAGRLGMLGPPPDAVDEKRAKALIKRLRSRLAATPSPEPDKAVFRYPKEDDHRVFHRMGEDLFETLSDGGASRDIVGALEHYLDFELKAPDRAVVAGVAQAAAVEWDPRVGCTRLYELLRGELRAPRGGPPLDTVWPRAVARVLIERSEGVNSLMAWRALGMLAPLLLAIAAPPKRISDTAVRDQVSHISSPPSPLDGWACVLEGWSCVWPPRDFYEDVRTESVESWRSLAREVEPWSRVLDQLRAGGVGRRAADPKMRAAFDALYAIWFTELGDLRPGFAGIDVGDGQTLWRAFRELYDRHVAHKGLTRERVRFGTLLGTRAHAILALEPLFYVVGRCRTCYARAAGALCAPCERTWERDRKRDPK